MRAALAATVIWLSALAAPAQEGAGYVGSATCTGCHTEAAEAWARSHHALAWTEAGPATVRAPFAGERFAHDGVRYRFSTVDGAYVIDITEADGSQARHVVHSVAGVEPLQQYLIETDPGRLQSFDVVWDTEAGGWFHLYPDQHLPPGDGLHWTGPYKTWNARCAECHATGFEKRYDPDTRRYASHQAEIGVGCEACHGPGAGHVRWASSADADPPPLYGFAVDFADTQAAIEQCAGCHSRREAFGAGNPAPGTPYHDGYGLALLRPGLYEADGQILDEVYVYGSFLQSKMYAAGVGCGDCHAPHSAKLKADGNALCTQCHGPAGNARFPTLSGGLYDDRAHHRHPAGSPGAQCAACHMTERVYMGNDWRADHGFRVPRPDLVAETGAPDACTTCHTRRDPAWAAGRIAAWNPERPARGPHPGQVLARGRADAGLAGGELAALSLDAGQPGIYRATALWLLAPAGDAATATALAPTLADPDPLVRAAAVGAQRGAAPSDRVLRILPLLEDPRRAVRIAAARGLLDAPIARLPAPMAQTLRAGIGEWQATLATRLDFPETHLQLGGVALVQRNLPAAQAAFGEAVRLDPQQIDAWVLLVELAEVLGGPAARAQVLARARAANPDDPTLGALDGQLFAPPPPPRAP